MGQNAHTIGIQLICWLEASCQDGVVCERFRTYCILVLIGALCCTRASTTHSAMCFADRSIRPCINICIHIVKTIMLENRMVEIDLRNLQSIYEGGPLRF